MPASGWKGKNQGQSHGGFAGSISYPRLAPAVSRGYTRAATDDGYGRRSNRRNLVFRTPGEDFDLGHRGTHQMSAKAKAVITEF
jgi:hypothetical protein